MRKIFREACNAEFIAITSLKFSAASMIAAPVSGLVFGSLPLMAAFGIATMAGLAAAGVALYFDGLHDPPSTHPQGCDLHN